MVKKSWWGRSVSIDLHDCDSILIKNKTEMKSFVKKLCLSINMKRVGPTKIKRFGKGKLEGYSLMQFIETSSITIHFDEFWNRAFIDVFSCKTFNAEKVVKFSKEFFKAKTVSFSKKERK